MKNKIPMILFIMVWCNLSIVAQELDIECIPVGLLSCEEVYIAEGRFISIQI